MSRVQDSATTGGDDGQRARITPLVAVGTVVLGLGLDSLICSGAFGMVTGDLLLLTALRAAVVVPATGFCYLAWKSCPDGDSTRRRVALGLLIGFGVLTWVLVGMQLLAALLLGGWGALHRATTGRPLM
jgi:hypothetical protein